MAFDFYKVSWFWLQAEALALQILQGGVAGGEGISIYSQIGAHSLKFTSGDSAR